MNSKEAAKEILEGYTPAQIGVHSSVSTAEAIKGLFIAIGEGQIQQSDLLFALDKELRRWCDLLMSANEDITLTNLQHLLNASGQNYDLEEIQLYLRFRMSGLHIGDMYADMVALERGLHQKIKSVLLRKFGEEEDEWWGTGVPEKVRTACVEIREKSGGFENHSYSYTTFIDLWQIIKKNWNLFSGRLPSSFVCDNKSKGKLESMFNRLNTIRNQLMHPVREALPTEDDYKFVKQMRTQLDASHWR